MSLTWLFGPSKVPAATTSSTSLAPAAAEASEASQCPVDHSTRSKWLQKQKTDGQSEALHPFIPGNSVSMSNNSTSAARARQLSAERETSTIPRFLATSEASTAAAPEAAESSSSKWVYPSPSQFFSALQRKDRNPKQEDMDTVVTIHNAVNERTWQEVMKWEREAGEDITPQLVTFKGRPNDRSPRAWWKVLIGYDSSPLLSMRNCSSIDNLNFCMTAINHHLTVTTGLWIETANEYATLSTFTQEEAEQPHCQLASLLSSRSIWMSAQHWMTMKASRCV